MVLSVVELEEAVQSYTGVMQPLAIVPREIPDWTSRWITPTACRTTVFDHPTATCRYEEFNISHM